jgi:hypothetical protein
VLFSDNFDSQAAGTSAPTNWTRNGGSSGDWSIATDGTQVLALAQSGSPSSTPRFQYASGASGAPWSGATSVAVRVKITATGSSNPAAMVCVRYMTTSNYYCAALVPTGVQILTVVGGSANASGVFAETIAMGMFYDLKLSVDASGLLMATFNGAPAGTFMPAALASGYAAVGTISMKAEFDNFVVTRP